MHKAFSLCTASCALIACSMPQPHYSEPGYDRRIDSVDGLRMGGTSAINRSDSGSVLRVRVTIYNVSPVLQPIIYGTEPIRIVVYPAGSAKAAWDERTYELKKSHRGGPSVFYPSIALRADIPRGDSVTRPQFATTIPIAEILGDSIEEGNFAIVARIRLNRHELQVPAGIVHLSRTGT